MSRRRALAATGKHRVASLLLAGAGVVAASCGDVADDLGGLMLVVTRDGPLPVDRLELRVESEGKLLRSVSYRVPDEARLPTTLGIASNGDPTATVEITVVGWNGEVPLDRRDAIVTQVPTERVAMLSVVLSGRCSDKVVVVDDEAISICEEESTCDPRTGACESAEVDASQLPSYRVGDEDGVGVAGAPSSGGEAAGGRVANGPGEGGSGPTSDGGMMSSAGGEPTGDGGRAGAGGAGSGGETSGCSPACADGETCTQGACVGADGCGGPAKNIALSELAAYQVVKVPLMNLGGAIAPGQRNAKLIQGRSALLRAFMTPGPAWTTRQLVGQLTVQNGDATEVYRSAKQSVSGASTDADPASTFQMLVPAEQLTADTQVAFELLECGESQTGEAVDQPRYPATGAAELGAVPVGPLKLTFLPIQANGRTPDVSAPTLDFYREYLEARFPVTAVEISVAAPGLSTTYPLDWQDVLDLVYDQRQLDLPAADVYYVGLLKPTDTYAQFCAGACTPGISMVAAATPARNRVAASISFVNEPSASSIAHELGHTHGRQHAPCPGDISNPDQAFPYAGGLSGVWGYDRSQQTFVPPSSGDLMSFCSSPWPSDYTYSGILERVALLNGY